MVNYRKMYLDLLAERNPAQRERMRQQGKLYKVADEIQSVFEQHEQDLTRHIARANLNGREPNGLEVSHEESVQALNMAAARAREILANDLAEIVGREHQPTR